MCLWATVASCLPRAVARALVVSAAPSPLGSLGGQWANWEHVPGGLGACGRWLWLPGMWPCGQAALFPPAPGMWGGDEMGGR